MGSEFFVLFQIFLTHQTTSIPVATHKRTDKTLLRQEFGNTAKT